MPMTFDNEIQDTLKPTPFIDSLSPAIAGFSRQVVSGASGDVEKAVRLYDAVRDGIRYSPYRVSFNPDSYVASRILREKTGFCVQKAILLVAVSRSAGLPCRLGFADVRNHLTTPRLKKLMRTDRFLFHGYVEFLLNSRWVKATPAFNRELCDRFGVTPLAFDGRRDSVFHPFDRSGKRHMEYIHDHGRFTDFPLERMIRVFKEGYPHLFDRDGPGWPTAGDFPAESEFPN